LSLAARYGVRAGAHPSFIDREHFGRRELERTEQQVFEDCVYQVGALAGLARAVGRPLTHLKPHGGLYNLACRDDNYARPIVAAAQLFGLSLVGLPGSRLEVLSAGRCHFVAEGFADRRYLPDGSLVPRTRPDAFVEDLAEAVGQVEWLVTVKGVRTVCVHGDNPHAVTYVRELRAALLRQGITLQAFA
jgi:5-oxoprolinase (ATP-hydrolysing) subunit A